MIHSSKTFGTNYSIIAKFECKDNINITGVSFKLINFGGLVNYYIDTICVDEEDNFNFTLKTPLFSPSKKPYHVKCNYSVDLAKEYDNHILIDFPIGSINERNYSLKNGCKAWCCGRECLFKFMP